MLSYPPCRSYLAGQYQHEQSAKHPLLVYPTPKVLSLENCSLENEIFRLAIYLLLETHLTGIDCVELEKGSRDRKAVFFFFVCACA